MQRFGAVAPLLGYKFAPLAKEKKVTKSRSVKPSSVGLARTPSGRTVYDHPHPQWPRKRASSSSLVAASSDRFDSAVAGPSTGPSVLAGGVQQFGTSTEGPYRATASQAQYANPRFVDPSKWTPTSASPASLPLPPSQHSHSQQTPYNHSHQPTAPPPQLYETVEQQWFPAETSPRAYNQTPPIPLLPPSAFTRHPYQISRRHTVSNNHDLYSHPRPSTTTSAALPLAYPSTAAPSPAESYEYWAGGATSNPLPVAQSQWPASAPLTSATPAPSYFHPQEHHLANPPPPPPPPQQPAPNYDWEGAYMVGGGDYIYSYPASSDYDSQHTLFDRVARRPSGGGC